MPSISFGAYTFDATLMSLTRDGTPLGLNARGAALLAALVDAKGATVSRQALLEAGWPGLTVEEANLTVQIGILRRLIGNRPDGGDWIATVPRIGYRLHCDGPRMANEAPSIAALPFQNVSGDPEQEYFADGITDDLITALSRLRGFFVIARNSTFAYKGKTPDVRQVARELGVRYVLEGSVRKAGDRLRVTAQLIEASTGNHIWADRYDSARQRCLFRAGRDHGQHCRHDSKANSTPPRISVSKHDQRKASMRGVASFERGLSPRLSMTAMAK